MDVKWLSGEGLHEKAENPGLLVVVPGEEDERGKIVDRIGKLFAEVNEKLASLGADFTVNVDGAEDAENVPLFFIREGEYVGNESQGTIQIVPLGFFHDIAKARKAGLEGADFLDKSRLIHMASLARMLLKGEIEKFDQANEEIGV